MSKTVLLAGLLVALTPLAFAQRGGRGGGGGGGGMGGDAMPGAFTRTPKAEQIFRELKIKDEQKVEIEAIFDEAQKQSAAVTQAGNAALQQMLNASVKGESSEAAAKAVRDMNARLVAIEADALAKVLAKIPEKDRKKAPKAFELMSGLFQSPDWRKVI